MYFYLVRKNITSTLKHKTQQINHIFPQKASNLIMLINQTIRSSKPTKKNLNTETVSKCNRKETVPDILTQQLQGWAQE